MPPIARALRGAMARLERELGEQGVELGIAARARSASRRRRRRCRRSTAAPRRRTSSTHRAPVGRVVVDHRDRDRDPDPEPDSDQAEDQPCATCRAGHAPNLNGSVDGQRPAAALDFPAWRSSPRRAAARTSGGRSSTSAAPSARRSSRPSPATRSSRSTPRRTSQGFDPGREARPPGRAPVHARDLSLDVPRAAVDDAPVRRLRHGRGDQRALPLPARRTASTGSRPPSTCRP